MNPPANASRGPLIVRLCNWVGEVVLMMPSLQRLERAGFDLHLVGKGWARALLEGTGWPVERLPAGTRAAAAALRTLRLQLAGAGRASMPGLLFTRSWSSALEFRLAGIAATGYAQDGRGLVLHRSVRRVRGLHESEDYWRLVDAFLGTPEPMTADFVLPLSVRQKQIAADQLAALGIVAGGFVLLCPFTGGTAAKQRSPWPGFAALATQLAAAGLKLLICPGPGEVDAARKDFPMASIAADVDLGVYAALLAAARCVVANDTGPGHMAAAVGARLLSISGPGSSPARWGVRGTRATIVRVAGDWPAVESVAQLVLRSG